MSSFRLSTAPIDVSDLARDMASSECGGFVTFEGLVRDRNEGRVSESLDYEAFDELAIKEGTRIVAEAVEKFGTPRISCVHRVGRLKVGETAVWVGVSAPHRLEAFAACQFVIDQVKSRVPIWKMEHYSEGSVAWVNCEPAPLLREGLQVAGQRGQRPDYSRQIILPQVGAAGQARLRAAKVLVVGAGGLGVPVLSYLAGAGVGTIGIADQDILEASNLHRQTIYAFSDIGRPKAELAASHLSALNPDVACKVHTIRVDKDNVAELLRAYDIVVDCSDNFATKFVLNDAAIRASRIAVFASIYQYEGQIQVYRPADPDSACQRCLWPDAMQDGLVGSCDASGTLGPVPGVLGSMQALEVLKIILDAPGQLSGELLLVDLLHHIHTRVRPPKKSTIGHEVCLMKAEEQGLSRHSDVEISTDLSLAISQGFDVIDIRSDEEAEAEPIGQVPHMRIPMAQLLADPDLLPQRKTLLCCAKGVRSRAAAIELRNRGLSSIYSLEGGVIAARYRMELRLCW